MMNKQKGNMYTFITHTFNIIKGRCPHNCSYCYCKRFPQSPLHFDEKELKTPLGEGNIIFVGSSCDMWADNIPPEWIIKTIEHCEMFSNNTYLFQSKNPQRFIDFLQGQDFPKEVIIGTTIETNRRNNTISSCPLPQERAYALSKYKGRKFVTIEPILDFDIEELVELIKHISPEFVNIGADSKNHNLPEPNGAKILILIKELEKFTKVNKKENLKRLIG